MANPDGRREREQVSEQRSDSCTRCSCDRAVRLPAVADTERRVLRKQQRWLWSHAPPPRLVNVRGCITHLLHHAMTCYVVKTIARKTDTQDLHRLHRPDFSDRCHAMGIFIGNQQPGPSNSLSANSTHTFVCTIPCFFMVHVWTSVAILIIATEDHHKTSSGLHNLLIWIS